MDFYEPSAKKWVHDLLDLRRRLIGALVLILTVTIIGVIGFSVIDPSAGLIRSFYMTAITLTTVGYGEEIAIDTDRARVFTAMLILVGMGATLYFVSTATAFLLEGQLGHVFRRKKMQRELANLQDHVIVCGSGQTAVYATAELAKIEQPVVLVVTTEMQAVTARGELTDVPIILGDATEDAILLTAGVKRATGVIACSESDNENVVVTLTARHLNADVRIVSRLSDVDHESKIRKVGANAVVSPQHIGGLRLASELVRPTVVTFLDTMLRDRDRNLRIGEVRVPTGAPAVGTAIRDIGLDTLPGMLLIAIQSADGRWAYNPLRSGILEAESTLIFLGSPDDARAMAHRVGGEVLPGETGAVVDG